MNNDSETSLYEPDFLAKTTVENIKQYKTLAEKIAQIGFEVQTEYLLKDVEKLEIETIKQMFGNIYYYMDYLRTLCFECPDVNIMIANAEKYYEKK